MLSHLAKPLRRTAARTALSVIVMAMALLAGPQPARAFFCFGFSMGSDGPSFRIGFGEPGVFRTWQFGPPGYPPTSYAVPWPGPPSYGPWSPPPQFMAPTFAAAPYPGYASPFTPGPYPVGPSPWWRAPPSGLGSW